MISTNINNIKCINSDQKYDINNFHNNDENIDKNYSTNSIIIHKDNTDNNYNTNILNKIALKNITNLLNNNILSNTSEKTANKNSNPFLKNKSNQTNKLNIKKYNWDNLRYSNEDKYSLLKIKKMKNSKFSPYKSTNHLFNKIENTFDEENKFLFCEKKNKKIFSLNKAYISRIIFTDQKNDKKEFKLFRDVDIGLSRSYKLKQHFLDFDTESDDEVIRKGVDKCMEDIKLSIKLNKKYPEEYSQIKLGKI